MTKKKYNQFADKIMGKLTVTIDKNPSYFEADLQLRNPSEELINFVINQLNKNNVWVAKITPLKQGIDLKVSSQRFARALGRKLTKTFKGELKTSRSLFTRNRQTSKAVYRVTVCFIMQPQDSV